MLTSHQRSVFTNENSIVRQITPMGRKDVPVHWPQNVLCRHQTPLIQDLEVWRDIDNDTVMLAATGNIVKEDSTTHEPRGRFRHSQRAWSIEQPGWYFRRGIQSDRAMDLTKSLLLHTFKRQSVFLRSKNNRLELRSGMTENDIPDMPHFEVLQKPGRPKHSYLIIGDLSIHGMTVSGSSAVVLTRFYNFSPEAAKNARDPKNYQLAGNGYLSQYPTTPRVRFDLPLFEDPVWPPYEDEVAQNMVTQHQREEDLVFEALRMGGAKYLSNRWCLSNTCNHFYSYFLAALIELDKKHWIVPTNWQSTLHPRVVDGVKRPLRKAMFWRSVGKLIGKWRPIAFRFSNRDERGLIRVYDSSGKRIFSDLYTDE
jgi:hypothetical protein